MRLGGRLAAAAEVLEDVARRRRPVADALKDWGLSHRFAGSGDRAAIGNIAYDVLRRKRSLGWRMGNDSPRALVFAALVDAAGPEALGALADDRFAPAPPTDGDLRRFAAADLGAAPAPVQADVPDWMQDALAAALGQAWVAEMQALAARPPLDLRVNTLLATREAVTAALAPFGAAPTPIAPDGLRIPPILADGRHPNVQAEAGFQTGHFEVQDEGSQIVSRLVGAGPGDRVLDYCAGAGGKTLALAALMGDTGEVHAYDSAPQRLAPIYDRLRRAEARAVTVHAPREDLSALEGAMSHVVVDAPCTGSGTWRRRPDAKWRLSASAVDKRIAEQDAALDGAARYVRPGGRLAYITCSLFEAENGGRMRAFLDRHPAFVPEEPAALWRSAFGDAAMPARPDAAGLGLALTPLGTGTDGFYFAACVRR